MIIIANNMGDNLVYLIGTITLISLLSPIALLIFYYIRKRKNKIKVELIGVSKLEFRSYLDEAKNKLTDFKIEGNDEYCQVYVESIGLEVPYIYLEILYNRYESLQSLDLNELNISLGEIRDIITGLSVNKNTILDIHSLFGDMLLAELNQSPEKTISLDYKIADKLTTKITSEIDTNVFRSLQHDSILSQPDINNYQEGVFLQTKKSILTVNSIYGYYFKTREIFINKVLNPYIGYIKNYGEKRYNLYLSIGLSSEWIDLIYAVKHNLKFNNIELNVGYYKSTYVLYIFNNLFGIKKGDSLIFDGEDKKVTINVDVESITFDGEFEVGIEPKPSRWEIVNHLSNLERNSSFKFSIIKIKPSVLVDIVGLKNLKLLVHKSDSDNYYPLVGIDEWCGLLSNEILLQYLFKSLHTEFQFSEEDSEDYVELDELDSVSDKIEMESVYVYLMRDNYTNMSKIGISNNPHFREKTLLSQSPSIGLVYKREYFDRNIARLMEKTLHNYFQHKRVRGEWFDLDENDLRIFKSLLGVE